MKVFLCENIHYKAYELLKSQAEIISDKNEISDIDAVITRNISIDKEFIDNCPKLKVVGVHGTGYDGVDMEYCRVKGIKVVNTPYLNADSVADLIVALTLNLTRKIYLADRMIMSGESVGCGLAVFEGMELRGKTAGFIGMGHIGTLTADKFKYGFGMNIASYSRSLTDTMAKELGILRCDSVIEVLKKSDIVCICVPLNNETKNMINTEELCHMKKGAYLINAARGGIVNEDALYHALISGHLSAAACDVFENEPLQQKSNKLIGLKNFLATPHIGATTDEALYRVGMEVVEKILFNPAFSNDL